jgi:triphosphoribosyl-dephospho-CoA synthetase
MRKYRLLGASQISLSQIGVLLDLLQQGFYVSAASPEMVAAGVLVEEHSSCSAAEVEYELSREAAGRMITREDAPHLFTDISDMSAHAASVPKELLQMQSDAELQPSVFDGTCCNNNSIARSYRIDSKHQQGYETFRCRSCGAQAERECQHTNTRRNNFNGNVSCMDCGYLL